MLKIEDVSFCVYTSIDTYEERLPQMIETWYKNIPNLYIFSANPLPNIENMLKNRKNINITVHIMNTTRENNSTFNELSNWHKSQIDHSHFMKRFYELNPNKKWYVLCDDDSYLYTDQLLRILQGYDSSEQLIIGRSFLIHDSSFGYVRENPEVFQHIHGGSGLVMSNPFASAVIPHILECTYEMYPDTVSDARIMLCAQNYIENSQKHLKWSYGFNALPPLEEHPITNPPVSYHKVFGNVGYQIWNASNSIWKGADNQLYYTNWINYTLIEKDILINSENKLVHFMFGYCIIDNNKNNNLLAKSILKPIFFNENNNQVIAYYQDYDNEHKVIYHCDDSLSDREILSLYRKNQEAFFELSVKCPIIQKYEEKEGLYQIVYDN